MSDQNTAARNVTAVTEAWTSMARTVVENATALNRSLASSFLTPQFSNGSDSDAVTASVSSVEHSDLEWDFERTVDDPDDIETGDTVTFEKTITEDDVRAFARVSGDTNRLHLDEAFAADTRFGERIVHGTLVSGLISAALARLPGLTVYLSQDLEFSGPVAIGDRVSARVEVAEDLGNRQYRLETVVRNEAEDVTVIDGEAVVLIDELPDE